MIGKDPAAILMDATFAALDRRPSRPVPTAVEVTFSTTGEAKVGCAALKARGFDADHATDCREIWVYTDSLGELERALKNIGRGE